MALTGSCTLADRTFVSYAAPGSKTQEFCREVLGWGKTLYTIESDMNSGLVAMGARPLMSSNDRFDFSKGQP